MPTDQSDPVAVLRACAEGRQWVTPDQLESALAELERRQGRGKRLEALVRRVAALDIDGTFATLENLVEAARKELRDG